MRIQFFDTTPNANHRSNTVQIHNMFSELLRQHLKIMSYKIGTEKSLLAELACREYK